MQIAVLADIHGNLPALKAVAAEINRLSPDLVVVAGDFQKRGPNPREVTEVVARAGWTLSRANHEASAIWQSQKARSEDAAAYYNWSRARSTAESTGEFVESIKQLPI